MDLNSSYGVLVLTGVIAIQGLFTAISSIPIMLNDIEDNHAIYYYLSLPISPRLIFVRYALNYTMGSTMMSFPLLPACKILLWHILDTSEFSLFKYLIFFFLLQIFFGFFALLITSYIGNMVQYERAWVRVVWPLAFLGGYQFSWQVFYKSLPYLAYLNLLNPITYCLEGFRAAVLGQVGYLNFWLCFGMLLIFTILTAHVGIKKFMHRLDCIN